MIITITTAPAVEPIISKERAKKKPRQSGIYQILCKPTGKFYVGSAVWLAKRKRHHREALLAGTHYNQYLQRAWNKYGNDAFIFSVLEYCEKEKLVNREQHYIDLSKAANRKFGFNIQPKAYSNLGVTFGPEMRAKISAARKGKGTLSKEQREELRERMKGNKYLLGYKPNEETKDKLRRARRGKKPSLGMHHSENFKIEMSTRLKGGKLSNEHCQKISCALTGRKQSKEHRLKLAIVQSKIKPEQFYQIKKEYIPGVISMRELALKYGSSRSAISNILNNKRMVSL